MAKTYDQIVKFGLASNGFYGLVYSNDNGKTLHLLVGADGRIFSQKDGDRIWPFLVDKVRSVMSIKWDDIQDKPALVTKAELDQRLAKLNIPTTMSWEQITDKPDLALKRDIPSVTGFAKETELADYAKKSELPSIDGLAKQTDLNGVQDTADSALSKAEKAQSTAENKVDRSELSTLMTWDRITNKPDLVRVSTTNWITTGITYINGASSLDAPCQCRAINIGKIHFVELRGWVHYQHLPNYKFYPMVQLPLFGFENKNYHFSGGLTSDDGNEWLVLDSNQPGRLTVYSNTDRNDRSFIVKATWTYVDKE